MPPPRHTGATTDPTASPRPPNGDPARTPPRRKGKPFAAQPTRTGPLEIIVAGCGAAAQLLYRPALRALERAGELVVRAAIDPNESSRSQFLEGFLRAEAHDSLESVTAAPDALVVMASPTRFHAAQATAAFKRGWHVLCHSPLAPTAREAALMTAAAERHERQLAVTLHRRFYPAARYLRTVCRDHLLGPAISFSIHEGGPATWPAPPPATFPGKFDPPDGVLAEIGIHTLDLLTWCLGTASVLNYRDDAMGGVEANAFLELSFPEGVRGTVHLSRDWQTAESYIFTFERGLIRWKPDEANQLTLQLSNASAALAATLLHPIATTDPNSPATPLHSREQSIVAELQNVISAISGRKPLAIPATAAMQPLALIEECYARRTVVEQPWLTHNEAVHARALAVPAELRRP